MTDPANHLSAPEHYDNEPRFVPGLSAWDLALKAVRHCVEDGGHYDVYGYLDPGTAALSADAEREVAALTWTLTAFDWQGPADAYVDLGFRPTATACTPIPDDDSLHQRAARRVAAALLHLAVILLRPTPSAGHRPRQPIEFQPRAEASASPATTGTERQPDR